LTQSTIPQQYYAPIPPTNTMAVLSLVFAFLFWPLSLVFGHIARKQIRESGERGRGLATAGLAISYTGLGIFALILWLVGASVNGAQPPTPASSALSRQLPASWEPGTLHEYLPAPTAPSMANLSAPVPARSYQDRFLSGEDGTYEVGSEIEPGTYKADPTGTCYWARLSSNSESDVVLGGNHLGTGRTTVTVKKNDAAFETRRCGQWVKVSK
jgi:Domain of unknown function (DUF4190)